MTETTTGEIVSRQVGKIPQTGKTYGYITVRTSDNEDIRIKIDASTDFETLKMGTEVRVEYESFRDSDILVARKVNSSSD